MFLNKIVHTRLGTVFSSLVNPSPSSSIDHYPVLYIPVIRLVGLSVGVYSVETIVISLQEEGLLLLILSLMESFLNLSEDS